MKPITIFLFSALLPTFLINAQVGIGTTNPNASLDIKSSNEATPANTDGILIPKIKEFPATNPTASQDGMMVFATGTGSITKGFYYWDNGIISWVAFTGASGASIQKLDDLTDGKSDNDGSEDGSSIFIGVDAGLNDDASDNMNAGIGFESLKNTTTGALNTAIGFQSLLSNLSGSNNTAIGFQSLLSNLSGSNNTANGRRSLYSKTTGNSNVAMGSYSLYSNAIGNNNVALGYQTLFTNISGSSNVALGHRAGYNETNSNRLYIENSASPTPLIYGEFDNDLIRINGDFEVEKTTDVSMTAKTPFGNKSSLKLFETNGSLDYGFEFEYDGSPDKLYLWSRTFSGNEGIRMTWLKNGKVGISTTAPNALLDVSSTNPAAPKNSDGMLVPRIDVFPSSNPTAIQNGMLVFLTTDNTFYYWRNSTTSWVSVSSVQKLNDLVDGKSDNDGSQNFSSVFLGFEAGQSDDNSDNRNVGVGYQALNANTIGQNNVSLGYQSLYNNTTGGFNTAIGNFTSYGGNTSNSTTLGYNALGFTNTVRLGNTSVGLIQGQVNFSTYSDKRVKDNIKENVKGLEFITKLRPVTYNFNIDRQNQLMGVVDKSDYKEKYDLEKIQMSGFIAQEVEIAANESNYNFSGVKIPKGKNVLYGLSYAEFVVPLVKAVQEQQTQIEALKKEIAEIKALLLDK